MKIKFTLIIIIAALLCFSFSTNATAANVKLKWQPNSEDDLQGYNFYFGNTSRNYGPPIPVGKNTNYTIQGLDEDQIYFFSITALDTSGNESGFSAEIAKQASGTMPPTPPSNIADGLVSLWLMDEAQGTSLMDASGNGHAGVLAHNGTSSNPAWQTDASQGSVIALDGAGWKNAAAGNYIDLGNLDVKGDQLSIGVMFKASSLDPYDGRLISKQTGRQEQNHYWMLSRFSDNSLRFRLRSNGSVSRLISDANVYRTNEWMLAVATYDGSQMKIYCNGQLVGSMAKSGTIDTNSSIHALIGAGQDGGKLFTTMDGQVAYAFVYQRALTQDEIQSIQAKGKSAFGLSGPPADKAPPLVTITSPTRMNSYETDQSSLNLVGEAQDSNQVTKVTWKSSNGDSGTAEGTTSWSVNGVMLSEGQNVITVTAVDPAGNEAVDQITVTYTLKDMTAPTVTIISPVETDTFETDQETLSITGTAVDNRQIAEIRWQCGTSSSGKAEGTTAWSADAIQLSEGQNTIIVTALDAAGNEASDYLTVTYTPLNENNSESPLALWLMDEAQGTTLQDASGNGNAGKLSHNGSFNNPLWQTDASQGSVIALNGAGWKNAAAGNYVDLGNLDVKGDQLSIGVMFKASSLDPYDGRLISKQTGRQEQNHYWMLSRFSKNSLRFRLRTKGAVSRLISDANLYKANEWVLAVATYDGSQMKIYCNGQLVGSMAKSGTIDTNSSIHALIGAGQDGGKLFTTMDGQVAYAFVYQKALSQDEIKSIHADGKAAFDLNTEPADSTPPLVTITSPTRMDFYENNQISLNLAGEAQDSNQVIKVTWKSSNGGTGTAEGTTSWSISGIALTEGQNVITVTAVDPAGNEATDQLNVTYTPVKEPIGDGLMALWLMDEAQGTSLMDASGNGHAGKLAHNGSFNNPLWQTDASQGSVTALNGAGWKNAAAGNYIDLGNLDVNGDQLSIGIMFKAANLDPYDGRLIAKQTGRKEQDHYWMLSRFSDNSLRFRLRTNGSVSRLISDANLYKANEWVLGVATYDGSQMKIYCNGQLVGSIAKTGTIDTNSSIHAFIGAGQDGGKLFTTMDGQVAYAFVYDRALSMDEIKTIHADGRGAFGLNSPSADTMASISN